VNIRIVASTNPRDLRPDWCPGKENVDEVGCPSVLPPEDLTDEHPRSLVNQVTVSSDATDSKPTNNAASVTTSLETLADIAVTAAVTTTTPSAGSEITYTLTGVNLGPSTFDNPVVVSTFPPGFVVEGDSDVNVPTMNCGISHTGSGASAVYTVTCIGLTETPYDDSFKPGITVPGTVTVHIPPDVPAGSYTATSHAYSRTPAECSDNPDETGADETGTCESNYANNYASVTVNVVETANTSLTKTLVRPNPLVAGQEVVYELTATNAGPSTAQDVTIADTVPDGLAYVSGTTADGSECASPSEIDKQNVVRCQAGAIPPGQSKTVQLTFKVDRAYRGQLCNTALVGSTALDPDADDNDTASCANTVAPPPTDVGVTLTPDKGSVKPGGPVGYTAVVRNNGPNRTTGTVVVFTIPPHIKDARIVVTGHTGTVAPAPACTVRGNVHTCEIGDMEVGDTVTYRVTGTATSTQAENLTLRAHVTHDDSDTAPGNDTATARVRVSPSGGGGGGGGLAFTGADPLLPLLVASVLLALGTVLTSIRQRRRPRHAL
jgi:uncharacterized repeat protein (TIGR01451 family)